jgi:hypothetical protein
MSIPESVPIGKLVPEALKPYSMSLLIALIALLSFGIGRLTAEKGTGVRIIYPDGVEKVEAVSVSDSSVYASSRGTRYYYAHCKSTVSEANKITFATSALAEAAGYTLAANCTQP